MDVRCPKCGRWIGELGTIAGTFGRNLCRDCSIEVTVRIKVKPT